MKVGPDPRCVVKVGDGRGFLIKRRVRVERSKTLPRHLKLRAFIEERLIVTAAHCLPHLPIAHGGASSSDRTYEDLVGPLDNGKRTISVECRFVDPVADIAVLGAPDSQDYSEQSGAYDEFVEERPFLRLGRPASGPGWVLSLDGKWTRITLEVNRGMWGVGLVIDPTQAGQSGSPILSRSGQMAVGAISIGAESLDSNGKRTDLRCGPQPILVCNLPGWLLERN